MKGEVGILNVGAGDTKLSFDKSNPQERARAARIVADMIKRGYALLIEVGRDERGPTYRRAHAFDEETCEYVIVGGPDEEVDIDIGVDGEARKLSAETKKQRGSQRRQKRVPAESTTAVSVGRVAGG